MKEKTVIGIAPGLKGGIAVLGTGGVDVRPMPKQGITSTFTTGMSFGLLQGVCVGLEVPVELVQARGWQKVMLAGMAQKDTKAASIKRCLELFPSVSLLATPRCKKPHDGMADALMIAEFGKRRL